MNTNIAGSIHVITGKRAVSRTAITWQRVFVHIVGLLPLGELIFKFFSDQLTVNPIQFIEQFLGRAALNLLVVALAVTPLGILTGWTFFAKHRRALGLYSFLFFALHFLTFAVLDYGLDFVQIYYLTIEKPFILVGLAAGVFLLLLAATSFSYWMKRLGKNWKRLHRLVYLIGGLAVLHYALAVKGSLATLSGDIARPLIMAGLISLLLIVRIPFIRRWISSMRKRQKTLS